MRLLRVPKQTLSVKPIGHTIFKTQITSAAENQG